MAKKKTEKAPQAASTPIDKNLAKAMAIPKSRWGWIGVDLDRTLAHYTGFGPPIGEPIPAMLARVKYWLSLGYDVRIFTARVASVGGHEYREHQRAQVEAWCVKHIGRKLPVTAEKDESMFEIWDDRAVRVERNTGAVSAAYEAPTPDGIESAIDEALARTKVLIEKQRCRTCGK